MASRGKVFVVSAPSGGGKGTILSRVFEHDSHIRHAVSATTRAPREGEVEGTHYYFLSPDEFDKKVREDAFAEWAHVHGERYGTLKSELAKILDAGTDVVLELDVQGMRAIAAARKDVVSIFLMPPSLEVLEERLRGRGDLDEDRLQLRLANAGDEIAARDEYRHVIQNDGLDQAVVDFEAILSAERAR